MVQTDDIRISGGISSKVVDGTVGTPWGVDVGEHPTYHNERLTVLMSCGPM